MPTYEQIVFMQDSQDSEEPLRILDEQGEEAAIEYLAQWHNNGHEFTDRPSAGSNDRTYSRADGYLLTYNLRLGYIGLEHVTP
jgi:hypothetical protein